MAFRRMRTRRVRRKRRGRRGGYGTGFKPRASRPYNMGVVYRRLYGKAINPYRPATMLNFLKIKRSFQLSCPGDTANTNQASVPAAGQYWMPDITCAALAANTAGQNKFNYSTGSIKFDAGIAPDISSWSGLYDQYRITGIKVTFRYMSGSSAPTNEQVSNEKPYCTLALVTDFDNDANVFSATDTDWQRLNERPYVKRAVFPNRKNTMSIYFKPKTLGKNIEDAAGTYTAIETQYGKWLDGSTASNAIYLGLQWMIQADPDVTSHLNIFRIYTTFYYQFKNRTK